MSSALLFNAWCRKEGSKKGIEGLAVDIQTKNESRRRLGGVQEENVVGDEGLMEDDEITGDG